MDANTKFWILGGLGAISAALSYALGYPVITVTVALNAVIVGIAFLVDDLQASASASAASPNPP